MEFDLENPFSKFTKGYQSDTTISDLFASESDHMPSTNLFHCLTTNHLYASFREQAISLILQAQHSCNYDAAISYLALNYMDRFFSVQEFPEGKPWFLRLIVVSCISLATKMRNTEFCVSNFKDEEGCSFDSQTIHRMEIIILDALDWRTRSITPFCFIDFFISSSEMKDLPSLRALKDRAYDVIFKAHHETKLLVLKPSIIAASALLVASHNPLPLQFASLQCSISSCEFIDKDMLQKCYDMMQEMLVMGRYESRSSTRTPLSVLDQHYCVNTESETTSIANTIISMDLMEERELKRRKLNSYI